MSGKRSELDRILTGLKARRDEFDVIINTLEHQRELLRTNKPKRKAKTDANDPDLRRTKRETNRMLKEMNLLAVESGQPFEVCQRVYHQHLGDYRHALDTLKQITGGPQ